MPRTQRRPEVTNSNALLEQTRMNRLAPLAGLLLVGVLMGTILSLQTNQIVLPFLVQQQVVYTPTNYLNNQTFYAGQTGSITLTNIMQAIVYTGTTIQLSTAVVNTTLAFTSLNFTLHFGSTAVTLNGLQNVAQTLTLSPGIYPVSLTIGYTTSTAITTAVKGSASITLTEP